MKKIRIGINAANQPHLSSFEYELSRILHRAQKYDIKKALFGAPTITNIGIYARLTDELWWLQQMRKIHAQKLEHDAIRLGLVHQRASRYVSDETLARRREQKNAFAAYSMAYLQPTNLANLSR